jgi:hypothetical protein
MSDNAPTIATTVAAAILLSLMTGVAAVLYKHELSILANARHVEQLRIKDYRQHRDILRSRLLYLNDYVNVFEAIVEDRPELFGTNATLALKTRKASVESAHGRLENYVEENKHSGRDD